MDQRSNIERKLAYFELPECFFYPGANRTTGKAYAKHRDMCVANNLFHAI